MSAEAEHSAFESLAQDVGEMRVMLEEILRHLVPKLKRDQAFEALMTRLDRAERRLSARHERPIVSGLVSVLHRLRHLDIDAIARESLESELLSVLNGAGYEEFGAPGDLFDPDRHEALAGRLSDGQGVVQTVHARGLSCLGDVVVKAQVEVAPSLEGEMYS